MHKHNVFWEDFHWDKLKIFAFDSRVRRWNFIYLWLKKWKHFFLYLDRGKKDINQINVVFSQCQSENIFFYSSFKKFWQPKTKPKQKEQIREKEKISWKFYHWHIHLRYHMHMLYFFLFTLFTRTKEKRKETNYFIRETWCLREKYFYLRFNFSVFLHFFLFLNEFIFYFYFSFSFFSPIMNNNFFIFIAAFCVSFCCYFCVIFSPFTSNHHLNILLIL